MPEDTKTPYYDIGQRLKDCRKKASNINNSDDKMTQDYVSEKMGISSSYYSSLERGQKRAANALLMRLAEFYGVSVDYLLYGKIHSPEEKDELIRELDALPEPARRHLRGAIRHMIDAVKTK